ncbi:Hypothetical predicted protein [Mytilus galloprovincialis]|uniref:Mab-21-like HhH/H2TH-like domain-containing protein n=1 Tax=Mytilus galloprovincialis TaxID=29158 RepID=A0A8B6HLN8_MYTGA|nr:Hypothetical predicted protein [Mytilus galloprovincialis]
MFVFKDFQVYENTRQISSSTNKAPIIMDIGDTKPGFTKLKVYNIPHIYRRHINQITTFVNGETYFSSKLIRELYLPKGMFIHGPCQSIPDDSCDMARCFQSKEWITPAQQWVLRSRSSWPDYRLVMSVIKKGVLFLPIGCRGSMNQDIEYRISFSMAEKQLIYSFSHTQLLCYALMKIILKDILKKKHKDLICFYFIKTILFWLFEESSPCEWHSGNMISCFNSCFKRLIYCVEYKVCLHYSIPENNLFEERFTEYQHKCLLDSLNDIYNSLWTVVFHTATFQWFREEQIISSLPYLTVSSLPCLPYISGVLNLPCLINRKQIISRIVKTHDKELSTHMMSLFFINWMQSPDGKNFRITNKSVYKQYRICLHCFRTGLYANAISAWSLLASLFYKHKRFKECIYIISYTLSKCIPDKIMLSFHNSLSKQTYFQKVSEVVGLPLACKYFVINILLFTKPYYLLPVELTPSIQHNIIASVHRCTIPAVVYLKMLAFLCLNHLEDKRGKLNALKDLELKIQKEYLIVPNEQNLQSTTICLQIAKSMI